MENWKSCLVSSTTSIIEAIKVINASSFQIVLVAGSDTKLLGTVTDGDIRRAILNDIPMDQPVERIMTKNPTTALWNVSREDIIELMREKELRQIPLLDENGRIVDLKILVHMIQKHTCDNWVVLMAGGMGNRLKPLTDQCPKPLLKVGGKPILETILSKFSEQGFHKFYISLNYKATMIQEYFGDGSRFGVKIRYLKEKKWLGTAGAVGMIKERLEEPFIVMNGDLLTTVNFSHLVNFHLESKSVATMCVRELDLQVPYGVVKIENQKLVGLEEEPVHSFFVNAGIYVLSPETIGIVPTDRRFDMTTLFEKMLVLNKSVSIFPIHEYWLDIGRQRDYERAEDEFCMQFES
jgi:dTDP-glucose pyrophosphorylase